MQINNTFQHLADTTAQTFNAVEQLPPALHRRTNWLRHRDIGICDAPNNLFYSMADRRRHLSNFRFVFGLLHSANLCLVSDFFLYIYLLVFFAGFYVFSRQLEFRSRTALAVDWGLFFQWKNCLRASINRALECVSVCIAQSRIHTHTLTGQRTKNQMRTLVAAESSLSLQFSGDNKKYKTRFLLNCFIL